MESFESEEQNLVLDVLGNGETVKLGENRCNMISVGDYSLCRVLYNLEPVKKFWGKIRENSIPLIQRHGLLECCLRA